jgi:hypothetical protein
MITSFPSILQLYLDLNVVSFCTWLELQLELSFK